jgi:hypothetical protein
MIITNLNAKSTVRRVANLPYFLNFVGHCLHTLCSFNAFHLAHLYHVPSIIAVIDKVRSTLNKLFRASEPLLVIIPHRCHPS